MSIAPAYPQTPVECSVCGTTGPGDIGYCPSCGYGKYTIPQYTYVPMAHIRKSDDELIAGWTPSEHTTKSNGKRTKRME